MSLVAGLIVAMGIVGLSRDATHTFHEEMRSSAAEANLRTAIDRLRADLARAGYMTTGNVILDPLISRLPGVVNPIPAGYAGLGRLSSIYLQQGGSAALTPLSAQQTDVMIPDMIDIAGNMTSTDQYVVDLIQPGGGSGGCTRIFMNGQSPSMYRILGLGASGAAELNNMFQPTTNGAGQFIVRLVDKTSHSQFLATCPGVIPTGIAVVGGVQQPYVDIDLGTPVQTAQATGTVGGLAGYGSGSLVNPVQIVRWQLMAAANEPAQYRRLPARPPASHGERGGPDQVRPRSLVHRRADRRRRFPARRRSWRSTPWTSSSPSRSTRARRPCNRSCRRSRSTAPARPANNPRWAENIVVDPAGGVPGRRR